MECVVDRVPHVDLVAFRLAATQESAQLLDQLADAAVVGHDVGDRVAQLGNVRRGRCEQIRRRLRVRKTRRERLRELVDERSGEHAHRSDARRMCGLRLRVLLAAFRGVACEDRREDFAEERDARDQRIGPRAFRADACQ